MNLYRPLGLVAALALLASAGPALADTAYPQQPLQLVVPYAAGGTTDLAGRITAKGLSDILKQSVVVQNRPGAAGSVGVNYVLRSKADGYTLAVSGVSSTMLHDLLGQPLPYNPSKDLNAVGYLGSSGMAVITRNGSPFKDLKQVIEAARAKPEALTFGSAGNTSPGHLATEYLTKMAGIRMTHVPYAGDSALMADLMSGRIDVATVGIASAFAQIESGAVKGLALTSRERLPSLPKLPTVAESGLPGYEADIWNLLVVPTGTPPEVDARLNDAVNTMMQRPDVRESLLKIGFTARPMTREEIRKFMDTERKKWGQVLTDAGLRPPR